MKASSTCRESMKSCMDSHSFAFTHLYNDEKAMDMHIHDCYEIYYSISGGKQFLIDNCFYDIQAGDLFLINQFESHYLSQIDSQKHERIIVSVDPEYLKMLSTEATDLGRCFHFRETEMPHRLRLFPDEQKHFLYFIHRFSDNTGLGEDILDRAVFLELMVFLNRAFDRRCRAAADNRQDSISCRHPQVDEILSYINTHIREDLSLECLAGHFYLSTSYICRIFKAATGTTISKYITAKRITLAKSLLSQGYSVNEACEASGFNDYSNFLKAFSKAVGVSPKKYARFTA